MMFTMNAQGDRIEVMITSYSVSLKEFKAWKVKHEAHQLLRCDDPRVKAHGTACLGFITATKQGRRLLRHYM